MDEYPLLGCGVAVATPFTNSGEVDYKAFRRLLGHLTGSNRISDESGGTDFLVVLGSTGEAATILDTERRRLIEIARREVRDIPLYIGTGSNATTRTIELTTDAVSVGVDGVLVVTPYYNKPGPEGLYAHYAAVAEAAGGKSVIAYNVPGRTGVNMTPALVNRLWTIPHLDALKESSGNLAQIGEILRTIPEEKYLLSGDDALALPAIALGADGVISVLGNIFPERMSSMILAALAGARDDALQQHKTLLPFMDAMFLESNPIPLKAALSIIGICGDGVRMPLTTAQPATVARLRELLEPVFGKRR